MNAIFKEVVAANGFGMGVERTVGGLGIHTASPRGWRG
jgi:hypothetical protein